MAETPTRPIIVHGWPGTSSVTLEMPLTKVRVGQEIRVKVVEVRREVIDRG